MVMTSEDVLEVLNALDALGIDAWVGGGWGVDALIGEQTRNHDDLDIAIGANDESRAMDVLRCLGLRVVEGEDWRPVRVLLEDPRGRQVDVHPIALDESGDALQANVDDLPPFHYPADQFVHGTIAGKRVPCIGEELQLRFHSGYDLGTKDRHDLARLAERRRRYVGE